jgi:hypothetical protein
MRNVVIGFVALVGFSNAHAEEIMCNKKQTRCVTESHVVSIGDKVGFLNEDNELVAVGEVKGMKGERRAVLVKKRHGTIYRDHRLTLLGGVDSDATNMTQYKIYQRPSEMSVGASAGFSTVNIGEGSPGIETTVYGQWRSWRGINLVARGVYSQLEGSVQHYNETEVENSSVSSSGLGLLGGLSYIMRQTKPLAFRAEVGLGLKYISAAVDGDSDKIGAHGYNTKVKNGVGAYGRWSLGAMYRLGSSWHVQADLAQSLVHEAFTNTLAGGISMDLK